MKLLFYQNIQEILKCHIKDKSVLHVGCVGSKNKNNEYEFNMHRFISQEANFLFGIDIFADGIQLMKDKNFNVTNADATKFTDKRKYDVVAILSVLQFLENPIETCLNLSKLKNSNIESKLIIEVPNAYSFRNIIRNIFKNNLKDKFFPAQYKSGETYLFSKKNLINIMSICGMNKVQIIMSRKRYIFSFKNSFAENLISLLETFFVILSRNFAATIICIGSKE